MNCYCCCCFRHRSMNQYRTNFRHRRGVMLLSSFLVFLYYSSVKIGGMQMWLICVIEYCCLLTVILLFAILLRYRTMIILNSVALLMFGAGFFEGLREEGGPQPRRKTVTHVTASPHPPPNSYVGLVCLCYVTFFRHELSRVTKTEHVRTSS